MCPHHLLTVFKSEVMANLWLLALGPAAPGDALRQAGVAPSLLGHPCQTLRSYLPCPCSFHMDPEVSFWVPLQTDLTDLLVGSDSLCKLLGSRHLAASGFGSGFVACAVV